MMNASEKRKPSKALPANVEAQRRFLKLCRQRGLSEVRDVEELAAKSALDLVEKGLLPNVDALHGAAARRGAYFLSFVRHYLNPTPQVSSGLAKLANRLSKSVGSKQRRLCFFMRFNYSPLGRMDDELSVAYRVTDGLDPGAFLDTFRQAKAQELFAQGKRAEAMQVLRGGSINSEKFARRCHRVPRASSGAPTWL